MKLGNLRAVFLFLLAAIFIASLPNASFAYWQSKIMAVPSNEAFNCISAYDANNAIVAADRGLLYQTTDGGNNWTRLSGATTAENFTLIQTTGLDSAYVYTGSRNLYALQSGSLALIKNYSLSFTAVNEINKINSNYNFIGQDFLGGAGYNFMRNPNAFGTFESTSEVVSNSFRGQSVSFANNSVGWVGGWDSTGALFFRWAICKTTDGGANWTSTDMGDSANEPISVYAIDQNKVWALEGGTSKILKSSNGGTSWGSEVVITTEAVGDMNKVKFVSDKIGWVVAKSNGAVKGGIYRTLDGGATWSKEKDGSFTWVDVVSTPSTKAYACGESGSIEVLMPPSITSLSTNELIQATTTEVTIRGLGFESAEVEGAIVVPQITVNSAIISVESATRVSSEEMRVTLNVPRATPTGAVIMTIQNIDTMASTAEITIVAPAQMTISSFSPASAIQGDFNVSGVITCTNVPDPGALGTVEVYFTLQSTTDATIEVASAQRISSTEVDIKFNVGKLAAAGLRGIHVDIKDSSGTVIASAEKTSAFEVKTPPSPAANTVALPSRTAWNPERDGPLNIQVNITDPGTYNVIVGNSGSINYKVSANFNAGYNTVVIPASSGTRMPNGIQNIFIYKDSNKKNMLKGKMVVFR